MRSTPMAADLKSLAHPNWPYQGTAHEWRGFVKNDSKPLPERTGMAELIELSADEIARAMQAVYQRRNFGQLD